MQIKAQCLTLRDSLAKLLGILKETQATHIYTLKNANELVLERITTEKVKGRLCPKAILNVCCFSKHF